MRPSLFNRALSRSVITTIAAFASLVLFADDKDKDKANKDNETTCIKESLQGNMLEVKISQLASTKAQNAEVKQFAERLVTDHKNVYDELKQLAEKRGIAVSEELDGKHQKMLDKFQTHSGSEFDQEFAKHMVKSHKKSITKYEKAAKEIEDAEVRSFVQRTLPTLKEHLRSAQAMARSVGLDETAITAAIREGEEAAGAAAAEAEIGKGEKKDNK